MLWKSLFSFFNFLPLLIIIPFGIFNLYKGEYSVGPILGWMIGMMSLSLSMNYANFIIKKKFTENLKALIPFVVVFAVFAILDYLQIFPVTQYSGQALNFLLFYPVLALLPLAFLVGLFFW